jgi:sulfur-oxidizing protein SoxX
MNAMMAGLGAGLGAGLSLLALGGCAGHVTTERLNQAQADPWARSVPLTNQPGDAQRGRAIVADRTRGMCLLCHEGPFPEVRQGNLAPALDGAGTRLTEAQLRARIIDARAINSASIMPAYHQIEPQVQVAPALRGQPVLAAQEIEDVVAFLLTLRDAPSGQEARP